MISPLDTVQLDLSVFENSSTEVRYLADFCAELLTAVKFLLNSN